MRAIDPRAFLRARPGYHYEPRVLWGSKTIEQSGDEEVTTTTTPFGVGDFYNAEDFPIVITKMVVMSAPLDAILPPTSDVTLCDPVAQSVSLRISRQGIRPFSFEIIPGKIGWQGNTAMGPSGSWVNPRGDVFPTNVGLDTVCWDFDVPIRVGNKGAVQLDIAPMPPMIAPNAAEESYSVLLAGSTAVFAEDANAPQRTPGSTRASSALQNAMTAAMYEQFRSKLATESFISAMLGSEFSVDPFTVSPEATSVWNNGYGMTGRSFSQQQSAVGRASDLDRLTVSFARRGYSVSDEGVVTPGPLAFGEKITVGVPPRTVMNTANHLAYSAYSRARTVSGGSGAWWWRQGAPLAICMPTITPCPVFEFKQPFVLDLGDQLDVDATIDKLYPGIGTVDPGDVAYASHRLYVSFIGYACIKD